MIRTIELIVIITLIIFAFFAGVKYSDSIKSHASWLFETKDEEEIELPDLSNENKVEIIAPSESTSEAPSESASESAVGEASQAQQDAAPMDDIESDHVPAPQSQKTTPSQ